MTTDNSKESKKPTVDEILSQFLYSIDDPPLAGAGSIPIIGDGRLLITLDPKLSDEAISTFINIINRICLTKEEQQHFQESLLYAENFSEADRVEMDLTCRAIHLIQGGLALSPTQSYSHEQTWVFIDEEKGGGAIQCIHSYSLHTSVDIKTCATYFDIEVVRPTVWRAEVKLVKDLFRFINPIMEITYK
jgi:hypothetical protein